MQTTALEPSQAPSMELQELPPPGVTVAALLPRLFNLSRSFQLTPPHVQVVSVTLAPALVGESRHHRRLVYVLQNVHPGTLRALT